VDEDDDFTAYVAARRPRLVRTAVLLGCPVADAEDLVQTALSRCLRSWRRVARADNRDAYVNRVLVNSLRDARARRWNGELPTDVLPDAAQADADIAAGLVVRRALATLNPEHREVLVLALTGVPGGNRDAVDPVAPVRPGPSATSDSPATPRRQSELPAAHARAATDFVDWVRGTYAKGTSPFAEGPVALLLGGGRVGTTDALGPDAWTFRCQGGYAGRDCPVFLDPHMFEQDVDLEAGVADVLCAPVGVGLPPRVQTAEAVSITPAESDCTTGYAVTLWVDEDDRIFAVGLQLAEP
jgi:hypothetical protein